MSGKELQFLFSFETKNKMEIIEDNIEIFSEFIFHNFSNSVFDATFPSELKNADVIPVFKKKDRNYVEN